MQAAIAQTPSSDTTLSEGPPSGAGGPEPGGGPTDVEVPALCPETRRFQVELEFVQCLANPQYLIFLAHDRRCLTDPAFVRYLRYLMYWKQPQYAKYISYPHALYFLELLQCPTFRYQLVHSTDIVQATHGLQYHYWLYSWKLMRHDPTLLTPP
ncbi:hypothetical protein H696_03164 [Fonticula alba]|uniref:Mediator of RNA polymerase II transcription subunit 31 n=1 Tax=Fonticula alba TaxID=691883 RepID=A0A058ZA47_FONAL|nr:hypothetical protein H696_03164 [Fonticula alba]KCV70813.1 hypothetical protein H696_03164 [Fonticula alba]|eukprot:XP_009495329.1 hypothetical protein H696_03164 [Fonticula alba]